jgi:hypothetical protein
MREILPRVSVISGRKPNRESDFSNPSIPRSAESRMAALVPVARADERRIADHRRYENIQL